jgi:hypothetical protein
MTLDEFLADAQAKASAAATAIKDFFAAHPEISADAEPVLAGAADTLVGVATTEVEKVAPPSLDSIIADGQAALDAKLQSDIQALTDTANSQKAALATAQQALASAPAQ